MSPSPFSSHFLTWGHLGRPFEGHLNALGCEAWQASGRCRCQMVKIRFLVGDEVIFGPTPPKYSEALRKALLVIVNRELAWPSSLNLCCFLLWSDSGRDTNSTISIFRLEALAYIDHGSSLNHLSDYAVVSYASSRPSSGQKAVCCSWNGTSHSSAGWPYCWYRPTWQWDNNIRPRCFKEMSTTQKNRFIQMFLTTGQKWLQYQWLLGSHGYRCAYLTSDYNVQTITILILILQHIIIKYHR